MSHAVLVQRMAKYFEDCGDKCEGCPHRKETFASEWGVNVTTSKCMPLVEEDQQDRCPAWSEFEEDLRREMASWQGDYHT